MDRKIKKPGIRKGTAIMQSPHFVAIMAILNAIVERFKDDAVKSNITTLGQPLGAKVAINGKIN
jgi:hypothetical protein